MQDLGGVDLTRGIQLAIDPNLVKIPGTSTKTLNGESKETDNDDGKENLKKQEQKLVANPYELFGHLPLEQFIPLMSQQRGIAAKFADLNEEDLLQEIKNEEAASHKNLDFVATLPSQNGGENEGSLKNTKEEGISEQDGDGDIIMDDTQSSQRPVSLSNDTVDLITQEEFISIKTKVLEHVNMALNESSLSLEFVSLLLSSTRTSAAMSSMSPYLKKVVPAASLNVDKIPLEVMSDHENLVNKIIHKGWDLRSLEECKKLLKQHNNIFAKAIENEYHYWKHISENISNKEVLFKLKDKNTGKRTLGIRYGYEDSGSCYALDSGVALLRPSKEASYLDLVPVSDSTSVSQFSSGGSELFMRIRIYTKIEQEDDYLLSGESYLNQIVLETGKGIKHEISRLRFFIFEKELMYQLRRESAQLLPYGVTVENENKIVLELSNEKIEFESVILNEEIIASQRQEAPKTNDNRANLMLVMLRMLLIVMYKKQLLKRLDSLNYSKSQKGYGKDLILLRAILGKIRHQKYTQILEKIMKNTILDKIEDTTLERDQTFSEGKDVSSKNKELAELQREIALFDKVLSMPRTDFTTVIPNKGSIGVSLRSTNYCNAFIHMKYVELSGKKVFDTNFSEFSEFEEFLNFIYNEFLL